MTVLSAPKILEPLTPCLSGVPVQQVFPGAEVIVIMFGARAGAATAGGPEVFVPLDPGIKLNPGAEVTVVQQLGGDGSDPWPRKVKVLGFPSGPEDLSGLYAPAPLLECATCVWIGGVFPGAVVSASIDGVPLPPVTSQRAAVQIGIPDGLTRSSVVTVSQTACGISGPAVTLPSPLRQDRTMWPAPAPVVGALHMCQRVVPLSGIQPGATVVLSRDGGQDHLCFGARDGWFVYPNGLNAGDQLSVRQEFTARQCGLVGNTGQPPVSADPPQAPWFPYPVCAGDDVVNVAGLEPWATVVPLADGSPLPAAAAPQDTSGVVAVAIPPGSLSRATTVGMRQTLCDGGPWSETGTRAVAPIGATAEAKIVEPLFACGLAVGVMGLQAGTQVWISSAHWQGNIGSAVANGDSRVDVPLWIPLIAGDRVSAVTVRCGVAQQWGAVPVHPLDREDKPAMPDPADDCGRAVRVVGVTPGAIVWVEQVQDPAAEAGAIIGSALATTTEVGVPIPLLGPGSLLRARQQICNRRSPPTNIAKLTDIQAPAFRETIRICQLTGETDPCAGDFARKHPFNTESIHIDGTDLGISVEQGGRLWFFFGDCDSGPDHPSEAQGDPIAWTDEPDLGPDGVTVPNLQWLLNDDGVFQRLVVDGLPTLDIFEVPAGAFAYAGALYLFIARAPADGGCPFDSPGTELRMRRSHLAQAVRGIPAQTPQLLYDVSTTDLSDPALLFSNQWFIHASATVVRNSDWSGLPASTGDGVVVFGTSCYHASNVYLAWFPIAAGQPPPRPGEWQLLLELTADGTPLWGTQGDLNQTNRNVPGLNVTPQALLAPGFPLGELSVAWIPEMARWVMTYGFGICRVARTPWGPWSSEVLIFDYNDPTRDAGNSSRGNAPAGARPDGRFVPSQYRSNPAVPAPTYAPYIVGRWTRWDGSSRSLSLVYTLSTGPGRDMPGYKPQLMRTTLTC